MFPARARNRSVSPVAYGLLACLLGAFSPARAEEDPLLGRIKVIQCVGCTPGSVDLIVHDPIDVRDFQVRIKESDYQKIIVPLAGKTVYDKGGCFYWMERPKGAAPVDSAKLKGAGIPARAEARKSIPSDSAAADPGSGEGMAPPPRPEIQGTPSRCIPYARIEPKPANPGKKED